MKVYLFLTEGFEEMEAITPIDIFRRAGMDVVTVSISALKETQSARGVKIVADELYAQLTFDDADLLYLPGGMPGTKNLGEHVGLMNLIQAKANTATRIAAICAAPSLLGRLNLLDGKAAVCYPGFERELTGAKVLDGGMAVAGNIYTAKSAANALDFALMLVTELLGKPESDKVAQALCYTCEQAEK